MEAGSAGDRLQLFASSSAQAPQRSKSSSRKESRRRWFNLNKAMGLLKSARRFSLTKNMSPATQRSMGMHQVSTRGSYQPADLRPGCRRYGRDHSVMGDESFVDMSHMGPSILGGDWDDSSFDSDDDWWSGVDDATDRYLKTAEQRMALAEAGILTNIGPRDGVRLPGHEYATPSGSKVQSFVNSETDSLSVRLPSAAVTSQAL